MSRPIYRCSSPILLSNNVARSSRSSTHSKIAQKSFFLVILGFWKALSAKDWMCTFFFRNSNEQGHSRHRWRYFPCIQQLTMIFISKTEWHKSYRDVLGASRFNGQWKGNKDERPTDICVHNARKHWYTAGGYPARSPGPNLGNRSSILCRVMT